MGGSRRCSKYAWYVRPFVLFLPPGDVDVVADAVALGHSFREVARSEETDAEDGAEEHVVGPPGCCSRGGGHRRGGDHWDAARGGNGDQRGVFILPGTHIAHRLVSGGHCIGLFRVGGGSRPLELQTRSLGSEAHERAPIGRSPASPCADVYAARVGGYEKSLTERICAQCLPI